METWDKLEKWTNDITKQHTIQLLIESSVSNREIMKELHLTEEELEYFIKKITRKQP